MTRTALSRILALLWLSLSPDRPGQNDAPKATDKDADFFAALLSHYLHQDALMWSRVQLLVALQAGVLTAAYAVRDNGRLASALLVLGASFTGLLFALVLKDELDRDANLPLLDALAERLSRDLLPKADTPTVRLSVSSRPWYIPFRGRQILRASIMLLLAIDILLALGFALAPAVTTYLLRP